MITCEFEDGKKGRLRHVTIGALSVNNRNEVLLVKRATPHRFGKYTIPGGFLERDEDTKSAVLRELKEETGYDGKIKFLFYFNDNPKRPKEDRQNVDVVYVVEVIGGNPTLNREASEIKWFSKENLPNDDDFAFDHRGTILKYFEYLEKPFNLPILN